MKPNEYARLVISSLGARDRQSMKVTTAEHAAARLDQAATGERYEIAQAIRILGLDECVALYLQAASVEIKAKVEIILAADALVRVGLADLATPYEFRALVRWTGYPRPFPCGHTAAYGFGPLDRPELHESRENLIHGKGRRYQQTVRVNQYQCSGDVLFSWQGWSEHGHSINTSLVVSIDTLPDDKRTCLKIGWTG